jgi:hypothetical protein
MAQTPHWLQTIAKCGCPVPATKADGKKTDGIIIKKMAFDPVLTAFFSREQQTVSMDKQL